MNRNSQIRQKCLKSCGKLHQVLMNYRNCCKQMKKYKLGEIATIINGVSYNPKEIIDDGIRILRGGNIQENDLKLEDNDVFLPFSYKNASNQIQWGDTIIVASTGSSITLGKVATCFETLPNTQIGAFLRIIRPKDKKWAMLISMWLHSSTFKDYILKQAKGTSINNIRKDYLEEFTLLWSENEVNGISRLYLNIANKIALNRAINHNLEAMAKQLYDYWFVQFDFPDENGKPYKSNGGEMIYSDALKKYIPKGWTHSPLRVLVDLEDFKRIPLSNAQRSERKGEFPYYGATGIMDYIDDIIFDYDILLLAEDGSTSDSNGFPVVQYVWGEVWVNNHAHIILPKDRAHLIYTYFLLKSIPVKMIETGSIQKKISQENLLRYKAINVPKQLRDIYTERIKSIWEQKKLATEEIIQLTKLRDSLLPLLMNGQASLNYDLLFLSFRSFFV